MFHPSHFHSFAPDHETKRASFLAKVIAPPSPTAIDLPVTPPDSPALFFFTLPSPGLVSPLALYESLADSPSTCWVEQVEFRPVRSTTPVRSSNLVPEDARGRAPPLPSLEEISSHFRLGRPQTCSSRPRPPLPAFLHKRHTEFHRTRVDKVLSPRLVTTSVITKGPNNRSSSGTALTEANLLAFEQRARASLLLQTLKRRLARVENMGRERRIGQPLTVSGLA